MKKILLFALPILAMCFASCEKDNGNDDNTENGRLIKTISDGTNGTTTFEYDSQNRIIKVTTSYYAYNDTYVTTYEYNGSEIIERFWYSESDSGSTFDEDAMLEDGYRRYILNEDGYLTCTEYYSSEGQTYYKTYTYIYDNGLLKKAILYNSSEQTSNRQEYTYEWDNNDIISCTEIGNGSTFSLTYTYYGNEDKENIMGWYSLDIPWQVINGLPDTYLVFKGMKSRHLVKSEEWNFNGYNIYYQFDADGYVIETSMDGYMASYTPVKISYY